MTRFTISASGPMAAGKTLSLRALEKLLTACGAKVRHDTDAHRLEVEMDNGLEGEMKMDDGRWEPCVSYRPVVRHGKFLSYANAKIFHTSRARWAERFKEIPR